MGTGIASDLYSDSLWPDLTGLFTGVIAGDPDKAFADADSYNSRNADGTYEGNAADVYAAVTCLEGDLGTDGVSTLDGLEQIDEEAPVLGRFLAYDDYAVLDAACTQWPVPVIVRPAEFDAEGAEPILVIGTSNDPATPYANAVSLAQQLSSGVLISYEGEGHTIYAQGDECIDSTVDDYLIRGEVPASDPMC
jgi:hypothetical protein